MYEELILKESQLPWQIYKRVLEHWDYEGCNFALVYYTQLIQSTVVHFNNRQILLRPVVIIIRKVVCRMNDKLLHNEYTSHYLLFLEHFSYLPMDTAWYPF